MGSSAPPCPPPCRQNLQTSRLKQMTSLRFPAADALAGAHTPGVGSRGHQSLGCSPPPAGPAHPTTQLLAQRPVQSLLPQGRMPQCTQTSQTAPGHGCYCTLTYEEETRAQKTQWLIQAHTATKEQSWAQPCQPHPRGCAGRDCGTPMPPPQPGLGGRA